uniref:Uncharacterized protein n=1 Tax=viral metagenome TaxID=1070528 RepID=A0A6M3JGY3_9ZZZZ
MKTIEIKGDHGKYYARATGPAVTIKELEILPAGQTDLTDLWRAEGPDYGRRIAIPHEELSWLSDGKWREYPYTLITLTL